MNLTELARRVKINTNELKEIIPELGFDIGKRAIQVDDRIARKIIDKLNNPAIRSKVLKQETNNTPVIKTKPQKQIIETNKTLQIGEKIIVKDLAKQMELDVTRLVLELMKNGVMASLNQYIDFETASIIAEDLGFKVEKTDTSEIDLKKEKAKRAKHLEDKTENLIPRPPVITIMGHVDHGKTKLLDAIRSTNVVEGEAGGITQHIGAYTIEKNNQPLTFIDTPGHEAFSAMRSRGAQVADIVILVVAADDGLKPQTIESISHIRSAKLPFIVAINKIDLADANIDKVKSELAELNLTPEDWGGKTICVEISAKQNLNIDKLLDTLLLVYEIEKDHITANPNRTAIGTIIESHLDKGEGPVATALIQTGTLKTSNNVKIGNCFGKIKNMKNWKNEPINSAELSVPAKIIGLKSVPEVGEILEVVADLKEFKKQIKNTKKSKHSSSKNIKPKSIQPTDDEDTEQIKKLNLIIKTDVLGSQEALMELLENLQQEDLTLNILSCGLGNINETDVEKAEKSQAIILGFNVQSTSGAELLIRDKNIAIKTSRIIYELIDFIKAKINENIDSVTTQETIGKAQILKIFRTEKNSQILGAKLVEGKIDRTETDKIKIKLHFYRNENILGQATISELQSGKQDVNEVLEGEFGIKIEGLNDIQEGDILEVIKEETTRRQI